MRMQPGKVGEGTLSLDSFWWRKKEEGAEERGYKRRGKANNYFMIL